MKDPRFKPFVQKWSKDKYVIQRLQAGGSYYEYYNNGKWCQKPFYYDKVAAEEEIESLAFFAGYV